MTQAHRRNQRPIVSQLSPETQPWGMCHKHVCMCTLWTRVWTCAWMCAWGKWIATCMDTCTVYRHVCRHVCRDMCTHSDGLRLGRHPFALLTFQSKTFELGTAPQLPRPKNDRLWRWGGAAVLWRESRLGVFDVDLPSKKKKRNIASS